jgi:hypothetical protein
MKVKTVRKIARNFKQYTYIEFLVDDFDDTRNRQD